MLKNDPKNDKKFGGFFGKSSKNDENKAKLNADSGITGSTSRYTDKVSLEQQSVTENTNMLIKSSSNLSQQNNDKNEKNDKKEKEKTKFPFFHRFSTAATPQHSTTASNTEGLNLTPHTLPPNTPHSVPETPAGGSNSGGDDHDKKKGGFFKLFSKKSHTAAAPTPAPTPSSHTPSITQLEYQSALSMSLSPPVMTTTSLSSHVTTNTINNTINPSTKLSPQQEFANLVKLPPINYLKLHLIDKAWEDIVSILYDVFDFTFGALTENPHAKILIHCREGVSRSAVLIISILMAYLQAGYETAY